MRSPRACLLAAALAALACACGGGADARPADWRYLHAAIIAPSCATSTCHRPGTSAGGLDLDEAAGAYRALLEEQHVRPGDPNSPLMDLLEGRERDRMPPDNPLPQADVELIRRWIVEGANP